MLSTQGHTVFTLIVLCSVVFHHLLDFASGSPFANNDDVVGRHPHQGFLDQGISIGGNNINFGDNGQNVGMKSEEDDLFEKPVEPNNRTFLYFAYGSNLWSRRLHEKNPSAIAKSVGVLPNYRLEFAHYSRRWRGGVANILPDNSSHVYGVLWQLKLKELASLDRQEGVKIGIYERFRANVSVDGQIVEAWTYQLTEKTRNASHTKYGKNLRPSIVYKDVILRGAFENSLPTPYVNDLKQIPSSGQMSECGGTITITSRCSPIIDYRGTNGTGQYGRNERCIWVIVPEPSLALDSIGIFVERQEFETNVTAEEESNDGILFYDSDMNGTKISKNDTGKFVEFKNTSIGFLYFTSDEENHGNGFKVTVIGREKYGATLNNNTAFWLKTTDCQSNFTYPSNNNNNQNNSNNVPSTNEGTNVAFAVQPDINKPGWQMHNVSFQFENPAPNSDLLQIYTLPVYSHREDAQPKVVVEESRGYGFNMMTFNRMTASTPRIFMYKPTTVTGSFFVQRKCPQ